MTGEYKLNDARRYVSKQLSFIYA